MPVVDVETHAADCRERGFLWGFFNGTIQNSGDPFHLGQTECAVIETSLRAIERGEMLAIHNPFPSPSIPLAVCASFVYSQHPRIHGGDREPMLLFPAHQMGYVSQFDEFHFETTLNPESADSLIPRTAIGRLSDLQDGWGVYTANSGFAFDFEEDYPEPGGVFVDLQKPEWDERAFDRIEEIVERHPQTPVVFYADEETPAFEFACDHADDRLDITNALLATAGHAEAGPPDHAHAITREEHILSNGGVSFRHFPVADDGLSEKLPDLIELKKKLQDRDVAYIEVARVFNRLTKQPFKPRYWTQQVSQNGYYKTVPEYIDLLESRADREGGAAGNALLNFCRVANDVQGHLNQTHKLQNVALNAVQRANADDNDTAFVFKNDDARQAFQLAMFDEGYEADDHVSFVGRGDLTPTPDTRFVFFYPPYRDDYVYQFPPSNSVAFIHHDVWGDYVERSARDATSDIDAEQTTTALGSGSSSVGDHEFSVEDIESDIQTHLQAASFGGGGRGRTDDEDDDEQSHLYGVTLHLSNGKSLRVGSHSQVTTYDPDRESIQRKRGGVLEAGEHVLLIGNVAGDIYDVLLDSAHRRDTVREHENLVEEWRNILDDGMDEQDLSPEDALAELQDRGSDITTTDPIKSWRDGSTLAPLDSEDARRVLELFKPGLEGDILDEIHEQVWKGVKHIRLLHRRMGRNVRRAIEAEFDPSATASFEGDVNKQMIRNIMRDVEPATIESVEYDEETPGGADDAATDPAGGETEQSP